VILDIAIYCAISMIIKSQLNNITDPSGHYHMVFEYADGGTLCEHLQKYFPKLTWNDKYKLGVEITDGLMYLHSLDIVHKDLVCISIAFLLNCYIPKFGVQFTNLDA